MEKNVFGYSTSLQDEIGIYLVSNDKALLSVVNQLMKKKGLVSVADTAGRQHYVIDARINPMLAARKVEELIFGSDGEAYEELSERLGCVDKLDSAISYVLSEREFDRTLAGTKLISRLLRRLVKTGETTNFKKLYLEAGKRYDMTPQQVERNIRYAIQKSNIWVDGMKNSRAFMILADEINRIL
ncbi:MAG: sporulation initiation factor Spo0A C-terminal domain-containing protein [Clostridia bacterium]|nr:sporulation initiation factor Spo0A C-terminal domain-containing protein [Clostridia bacterium]